MAEQTLGDESSATHTHLCTQSTPTCMHLHTILADTQHTHIPQMYAYSPHTLHVHTLKARTESQHRKGPCRQHSTPRQVPEMFSSSQGGPVKWGHPDTPGHSEQDPQSSEGAPPAPLSCPSEPSAYRGNTHSHGSRCDHHWPPPALTQGPGSLEHVSWAVK